MTESNNQSARMGDKMHLLGDKIVDVVAKALDGTIMCGQPGGYMVAVSDYERAPEFDTKDDTKAGITHWRQLS